MSIEADTVDDFVSFGIRFSSGAQYCHFVSIRLKRTSLPPNAPIEGNRLVLYDDQDPSFYDPVAHRLRSARRDLRHTWPADMNICFLRNCVSPRFRILTSRCRCTRHYCSCNSKCAQNPPGIDLYAVFEERSRTQWIYCQSQPSQHVAKRHRYGPPSVWKCAECGSE